MSPVIQIEDVHLRFPRTQLHSRGVKEAFLSLIRPTAASADDRFFWALRGVSFSVGKGEVLGILGPNGSGKSSLLRVIAGIYAADKGRVLTKGRISSLIELGAGFRPELTGLENIKLSGSIVGLSPEQIRGLSDEIVTFSGLSEFIRQPVRTYSSGMRVRLGFAIASVIEPEILLIDEVLSVGDAEFREKSMARIEQLVQGDTTVVVVSHNVEELRRLSHRMVLIQRGQISKIGDPSEVIEAYNDPKAT